MVNYEVLGTGKKNLLILHGWGGSLSEWLPVAENLKDKYKVWLLDFPGFGASPRPVEDWGIYEYAKLTAEFMKSAGLARPIILGHSFGGRVAVLLKAGKLILLDAAGVKMKKLKSALAGVVFDVLGPFKKYVPQNFKNLFGSADYKSSGPMRKIFVKTVNQDLTNEMSKVTCQTIIVWGEKDLVLPLSQAMTIKNLIKGSVLRVVWGADHWPHLSKPDQFMEILEEEGI